MSQDATGKLRQEIAEILYDSFAQKINYLWIITKDKEKAVRIIKKHMNLDLCFIKWQEGKVAGVASIETKESGNFIDIPLKTFIKEFSFFAGIFRYLAYQIYKDKQVKMNSKRIHLDLVAVNQEMRGQGIGSSLLQAAYQLGKRLGKTEIVLEVVDSNPRAKKLYEKQGFVEENFEDFSGFLGLFTKKAGFQGVSTMVFDLNRQK